MRADGEVTPFTEIRCHDTKVRINYKLITDTSAFVPNLKNGYLNDSPFQTDTQVRFHAAFIKKVRRNPIQDFTKFRADLTSFFSLHTLPKLST